MIGVLTARSEGSFFVVGCKTNQGQGGRVLLERLVANILNCR